MERHEADEQLRKAVIDHAFARGWIGNGELLTEMVVVAHWLDAEESAEDAYTLHFPTEHMAVHHTRGLLHEGLRHLGGSDEDD